MLKVASLGESFCKLLERTPTCRRCPRLPLVEGVPVSQLLQGRCNSYHKMSSGFHISGAWVYGKRWFGLLFLEMLPS